jgi:hypothetical protein
MTWVVLSTNEDGPSVCTRYCCLETELLGDVLATVLGVVREGCVHLERTESGEMRYQLPSLRRCVGIQGWLIPRDEGLGEQAASCAA